jgi:hypothetical protein
MKERKNNATQRQYFQGNDVLYTKGEDKESQTQNLLVFVKFVGTSHHVTALFIMLEYVQ